MMIRIYYVALELVRMMRPVIDEVGRFDADLARQMKRALTSMPLNIAEGSYSRGKNRTVRYQTALGSTRETLAGVETAQALRYLGPIDEAIIAKFNHVIGTLVNLVKP